MNSSELIKYIENSELLEGNSLNKIENTLKEYPYFQTAHKLLLKNLKQTNSNEFNLQLSKSSIYISDRSLLYYYLNKSQENTAVYQNEISLQEKEEQIKEEITPPEKIAEPLKEKPREIKNPKLLKNHNVRRKIKEGFDGMGDNISVTISSQLEFVKSNIKENLEYSPEIYFIDEEKLDKNKILTIEVLADDSNNKNGKDLLQIDESQEIEKNTTANGGQIESDINENIEFIESSSIKDKKVKDKKNTNQGFDISHYADEDEILKNTDENDLIAKFIIVNPRIDSVESYNDEQKDISEHSIKEDDNLLTETLAKVYIAQGYFDKALKSYEKLCLKYPEKNTYFAGQIEMIKELINKQKNS